MSKLSKQPTAPFTPFAGCAIMLSAITVFGGIIGWSYYSLRTQDAEISKFTVEQPNKPIAQLPDATGVAALKQRLADFTKLVADKKPATLNLTVAELNALMDLAPDSGNGKFAEMVAFKGVKDGRELIADVCFPLNKMKFWEGKRYAVGEATFVVEIVKDQGPDVKLGSLTIPGKTINPGFFEAFSGFHWLTAYQKVDAVGPTLKAINKISVTATGIELGSQP
jgi:hypothetical protein